MQRKRKLQRDKRNGIYFIWIRQCGVSEYFKFGANKKQAEEDLKKIEQELAAGTRTISSIKNAQTSQVTSADGIKDMRISELYDAYMDWVEVNRSKATYDARYIYLNDFLDYIKDHVGECMVSKIDQMLLSKFHTWAKKNHGYSENAGNTHLRHVKTMIRWGDEMGICACPVRKFPPIREAPAKIKTFSDAELDALRQTAPPDFWDMIVFCILTGGRPQEVRTLTTKHIQDRQGQCCVILERHKTSMSSKVSKPRTMALSPKAVEILKRQLEKHPDSEYIFLNDGGTPYTAGTFRQRLERECVKAGIEKKCPYALRHYFGTREAGLGTNSEILRQMMGHTTTRTLSRYVANVPEYHQQAVNALEKDVEFLFKPIEQESQKLDKSCHGFATEPKGMVAGKKVKTSRRALITKARVMVGTTGFEPVTSAV